ncbi:amidohydrolase [Aestuariibacter salexigens]|uniref:amidohydrolase n=1 Tax=Aestuariibacter salexigens TaxID=226010 RepID=UPI000425C090|nr:amidohydrolase [Aestuariibacter salexigens]
MNKLRQALLLTLLTLTSFLSFGQDFILHNVQGQTLNNKGELISFTNMVVEQGKVAMLNVSDEQLAEMQLKKIDGQGKHVLPGLIDAHGHILRLGETLLQVDVRDLPSATATVEAVAEYARKHPQQTWITGRGWNQVLWPGKAYPTATQLDEFIADKPVWLERVDGHAGWANSKALEMAGITKDTLDPPGGKIIRDDNGNPTGILIDNAMKPVDELLPKKDESRYQAQLDAVGSHLLSLGITSAHDAGISKAEYDFYQSQVKQEALPFRVYAMLSATDPALQDMLKAGYIERDDDMLSIRSVKVYGDGALGSRGAAMLEPYSDAPHNHGLLVTAEKDLKPLFDTVIGANFQLNYHAIGDKANRLALDQFANTFSVVGGRELRHRVEHAQVINVDDILRFKALNIIPSMQPTHATSDMNMAEDRVGKARLAGAYAWQTFLQQGSPVAFGSDFPVELANPFYGLHAAVTRQNRDNMPQGGWIAEEAVTLQQAFRGFTLDAAYSAHQDDVIGTLEVGKWADFIVVDRDLFSIPAEQIWRIQVLQTWIAGERRFSR